MHSLTHSLLKPCSDEFNAYLDTGNNARLQQVQSQANATSHWSIQEIEQRRQQAATQHPARQIPDKPHTPLVPAEQGAKSDYVLCKCKNVQQFHWFYPLISFSRHQSTTFRTLLHCLHWVLPRLGGISSIPFFISMSQRLSPESVNAISGTEFAYFVPCCMRLYEADAHKAKLIYPSTIRQTPILRTSLCITGL